MKKAAACLLAAVLLARLYNPDGL